MCFFLFLCDYNRTKQMLWSIYYVNKVFININWINKIKWSHIHSINHSYFLHSLLLLSPLIIWNRERTNEQTLREICFLITNKKKKQKIKKKATNEINKYETPTSLHSHTISIMRVNNAKQQQHHHHHQSMMIISCSIIWIRNNSSLPLYCNSTHSSLINPV